MITLIHLTDKMNFVQNKQIIQIPIYFSDTIYGIQSNKQSYQSTINKSIYYIFNEISLFHINLSGLIFNLWKLCYEKYQHLLDSEIKILLKN